MSFIREKPHRLPRECYRGRVTVSFTACINDRLCPFRCPEIVAIFLQKLSDALAKRRCIALIYCFMPDHLHVVIQGLDEAADTWQAMVDFKRQTGFWLSQHRPEFSWQKDFHDHIVRASEDLTAHIGYIGNNPVRGALVAKWEEYPFTGAIGVDLRTVIEGTR